MSDYQGPQYRGPQYAAAYPSPPPAHQPPPSSRKRLDPKWVAVFALGLAILLVVVVIGGILLARQSMLSGPVVGSLASSSSPSLNNTMTVTAAFELADSETADSDCEGVGGYSDIETGAPAVIYNGRGDVIGSSTLPDGEPIGGTCTWTIVCDDVPRDEAQYAVEVADRGKITKSRSALEANGLEFAISLGS